MNARLACCLLLLCIGSTAWADGSSVGKIYLPYVQPLEKEFEYRLLYEDENDDYGKRLSRHQLGFGMAANDRTFVELSFGYNDADSLELEYTELEVIYQLTEQGEYSSDWGLLVEFEKKDGEAIWEAAVGVLNSLDWRRWQLTGNLLLEYEWGEDIDNEFESSFAAQAKYRHRPELEPGLEVFVGQDTLAIGPFVAGMLRADNNRKVFWELALLLGGHATPDRTLKLELEYEFF